MTTKLKMKKIKENNKWANETVTTLKSRIILSELKIKVIIMEAVLYYLTDKIDFALFIKLIDRIEERREIAIMPELDKMIIQLLSLSRYSTNPATHREYIVATLNDIVDEIVKE